MSTLKREERVGAAWRHHREGRNEEAIAQFREILKVTPENIDAHYGLGLALRANKDSQGAAIQFKKALELATNALEAVRTTSTTEGHVGGNDLESYEDDRYMMLQRMISQRVEELA